jgi:hypothetical protein
MKIAAHAAVIFVSIPAGPALPKSAWLEVLPPKLDPRLAPFPELRSTETTSTTLTNIWITIATVNINFLLY